MYNAKMICFGSNYFLRSRYRIMATSDIEKLSVYDARIVQNPAKFAVEKGGLSVTNAPFQAIGASASQMTFNINAPSQNVFLDRAVDWTSKVNMQMKVAVDAAVAGAVPVLPAVDPVIQFGRDCALCALPLNSLLSTLTATINDTSVVINSDSVLKEVLRLSNFAKTRRLRTTPTKLDMYQNYNDSFEAVNSALAGYTDAVSEDYVGNGAWYDIQFYDLQNNTVLTSAMTGSYIFNGITVNYVAGVPVRTAVNEGVGLYYPIGFQWRVTEKLVLSPFIFADAYEYDTGLFGLNNIQLVMNFKSSAEAGRVLRSTTKAGRAVSEVQLLGSSPFTDARVNCIFVTPSLDIPLPAKSVIPYMEFPRYITTSTPSAAAGTEFQIQSQTIVLPNIPDLLIIYAKPQSYGATEGDWYYPIRKISVNFDNFSGLLASHTTEQLYAMSQHNGLEMSYEEWIGIARVGTSGANVATVGGPLVLKPGTSFALQSGQAPSLIGNFTLQFNLTCYNNTAVTTGAVSLYVIAVNSGFFETLAGSSRIIKGVLSEADIISAPPAAEMTVEGMKRMVGAGFLDRLGSFFTKARDIYHATKPAVSAMKAALPEGKVKSALGAVGYGASGGAKSGGMAKGLAARLL